MSRYPLHGEPGRVKAPPRVPENMTHGTPVRLRAGRIPVYNTPMKICMVTSSYPKYPGDVTAPFIESIAAAVAAQGHEVHVLAPWHPDLRHAPLENGVHLHFYKYAPRRNLNIWGYAESLEADVRVKNAIYPLTPWVLLVSFFALLRLTGRIRFDILQAHWVIPNSPVAVLVARLRGLPLVISLHGSDVFVAEQQPLLGRVARLCFRAADGVTACSGDLRERALALGAPLRRSRVVPYGVDPCAFAPTEGAGPWLRSRLGLAPSTPVVLALGRLVYKKGFTYLVQAAPALLARHPGAHVVIAGTGDLQRDLQAQIDRLGVGSNVHLPGKVSHDDVPRFLGGCDVFVLPSIIDQSGNVDGLPNALLEAMAVGCPVVASNVAGVPLAVQDGKNGLLVPSKDSAALAAAIGGLLTDPARRQALGSAARMKIETELNWPHIAGLFEAVYRGSIQRHARRRGRWTAPLPGR
ncbi:MAG TPA: glycosyltransferase family 4 protein [Chloroflexia bacterium]|nr:glycosyltransferase family 4 protein [Chloroflexia bacterium]